jgi:hypothetical protein
MLERAAGDMCQNQALTSCSFIQSFQILLLGVSSSLVFSVCLTALYCVLNLAQTESQHKRQPWFELKPPDKLQKVYGRFLPDRILKLSLLDLVAPNPCSDKGQR